MKECVLYKKLIDLKVQCRACSHYCQIKPGKTGICRVRKNEKGALFLLVYGRAAAQHIDPIEKKPLYHFMPGTRAFSIGTVGCNFRCGFCQNWDISQASKDEHGRQIFGLELTPKQAVDYCLKNKIPIIAYTYNEPTIWIEYALDIMKLAQKNGLSNVWVSNGYQSKECLDLIAPYLDAINIDLKAFSDEFYVRNCGARLAPVLETIKRVKKLNLHQEITTLIVPGQNDSSAELKKIAKFIADLDKSIPWHISRFFPHYQMNHLAPTDAAKLAAVYKIGKTAGLRYIHPGNIAESEWKNIF